MDSRIYFHQYRRPRFTNPTYVSTNVNHSLGSINDQSYQMGSYGSHLGGGQMEQYARVETGDRSQGFSLNKPNPNIRERYNTINASYEQPPANLQSANLQTSTARYPVGNHASHQRMPSNLSSYGSNSLSLNQSDIYNKQNSKFNIITMQPKQFDTSIRQHPKYTLENKDELYYKRMADQLQKKKIYEDAYKEKRSLQGYNSASGNGEMIAGKHTYGMDRQKQAYSLKSHNPSQHLNINPETLMNQYQHSQGSGGKSKEFNPKLLSQMDELISLS